MRTTCAVLLAVAATTFATACSKTEEPAGPMASAGVNVASPEAVITPPSTRAPEVGLPPLPSNITAAPEAAAPQQPTARDTQANDPKGDLTKAQETAEMPKANQANNHSSTALDQQPQPTK